MEQNPYIRNPQLPGETFFLEGNETGILLLHGYIASNPINWDKDEENQGV